MEKTQSLDAFFCHQWESTQTQAGIEVFRKSLSGNPITHSTIPASTIFWRILLSVDVKVETEPLGSKTTAFPPGARWEITCCNPQNFHFLVEAFQIATVGLLSVSSNPSSFD